MKTKHGILEAKMRSVLAGFAVLLAAAMFTLAACGDGAGGGDNGGGNPLEIPANMLGEWEMVPYGKATIDISNNADNIGIINWNYNVTYGYTHWGDSRVLEINGAKYSVVGGSYSVKDGVVTGGDRAAFDAVIDDGFLKISNSTPLPVNGKIWCGPDSGTYYQGTNVPADPVLTGVIVAGSESDANNWTQASSFSLGSKIYFAIECSDPNNDITICNVELYKGTAFAGAADAIVKDISSPFKGYLGYLDIANSLFLTADTGFTLHVTLGDSLRGDSAEAISNTFALTN
jgi:hypothetical protein